VLLLAIGAPILSRLVKERWPKTTTDGCSRPLLNLQIAYFQHFSSGKRVAF
jgi:hypothetical protein